MASEPVGADIEYLRTTKSEKLLALVMTAFLLVGGVWAYQRIDDGVQSWVEIGTLTPADRAAVARRDEAQGALGAASARVGRARQELVLRRERYRTALDANRPAAGLERRYRASEASYARAVRERAAARRKLDAAAPAAAAAENRIAARVDDRRDRQELVTFLFRLLLVVLPLLASYRLLARLRSRNSRWLPLAAAGVAFATILAFALATDYVTDYVDPLDAGILVLALIGVAATMLAFLALQRYLVRRLPQRRVGRRQCPFCGYAVGAGEHCEGCGQKVVAACPSCGEPRRVGTRHCAACGAA